jgi:uncharacterized protein YcbK (DUF882 family)
VLIDLARQLDSLSMSHAGLKAGMCIGLTSMMLLLGAGSVRNATAENDTRTLSFHHTHSGEDLTVTFKREGRYDEAALKQLNHFLRDWRSQEETVMDRHLFDILWEVYRDVDGKQPIQIISSYRSPATNAMLHRRSSGVARHSQHMLGHAMDMYIPGVPLEQIRFAGLRLQRGGVGFYPTSGSPFVHLDTGSIRHWPRMTHDQLAQVFPDGRTVHVPTDGVPLKGYELARADIEKRGNADGAATLAKPSFLAALFKGGKSTDDEDEPAPAVEAKPLPAAAAKPAPMPRAKPIPTALQLASADVQAVQPARPKAAPAETAEAKPQTPADIINARGFWGDSPAAAKSNTTAQVVAAVAARKALEAADPQSTAATSTPYQAMAYAPPGMASNDRSATMPRSARAGGSRSSNAATGINPIAGRSAPGQGELVSNASRLLAAKGNDIWLRIVMLAPSASSSMSVTVMGDTDLSQLRTLFIKPQATIPMSFAEDPTLGLATDHFSGSAVTKLQTTSFALRTALLR